MDNANEELQELIKEYDIYLENYNSECRVIKEFEQSIVDNETAVRRMMEDESVSTNPEFVEIYTERLNILRDMYERQKDYLVALSRSKEEYEEEFQIKKRELEDILRNQENNDEQ